MAAPSHTLLMIRPLKQARAFTKALNSSLLAQPAVHYAPILEIAALDFEMPPGKLQALLFTSSNGVHHLSPHVSGQKLPALSVGPETHATAKNAGFDSLSADGSVDDLIELTIRKCDPGNGALVHVRGLHSKGRLANRLVDRGFQVHELITYDQKERLLSAETLSLIRTGPVVLPVFSPRSARLLVQQTGNQALSNAHVVAISSATASVIEPFKPATLHVAKQPDRAGMIERIAAVYRS